MEVLDMPVAEEELRPDFEAELDILAFELWQRGSREDLAAAEETADDDEIVGCHASCL